MSTVVVEVEGVEHTYATEEEFVCEQCDAGWLDPPNENSDVCPECGEERAVQLTAERITDRPKWLWDGAESIDEMVSRTEHKAKVLRRLQEDGWSLNRPPQDGYAFLTRPVENNSMSTAKPDSGEVSPKN